MVAIVSLQTLPRPPMTHDIATLIAQLKSQNIHTLFPQYVDLHGVAKGKFVPVDELVTLVTQGAGFAGFSIWGLGLPRSGKRAEYYARADLSTLQPMSWLPGYARVVCDGFVDNQAFEDCPRQVLKRQSARLAQQGWVLNAGLEPEFFLLRKTEQGWTQNDARDVLDKPSYDYKSVTRSKAVLEEIVRHYQASGLRVYQTDHEDALGQFEVNYDYAAALKAADNYVLFKMITSSVADAHGLTACFMPKPFAHMAGSGLHFHLSLADAKGTNLFEGRADALELSPLAYHFIAGLLAHAGALCALCAPTVNSYKRLVTGNSISGATWAPTTVSYGPDNRTCMIRSIHGRIELRVPDPACNPYLALAAVIAAGLDGITRKLHPGAPSQDDLEASTAPDAAHSLPQDLGAALAALQADSVLTEALGGHVVHNFIELKQQEWQAYRRHVSDWELDRYAGFY
jgi:glutamine synthetase